MQIKMCLNMKFSVQFRMHIMYSSNANANSIEYIYNFIVDFGSYMQVRMSCASFRDLAQSLFVLLFGARY